ncbi:MAG: hypothetical protein RL662_706 [Bacteroidota bacterium]|jgi:predicted acetyltransferase
MIEFKSSELQHIKHLRNSYFYEVKLAQELFIEWMVRDGKYFRIYNNTQEVGYFIIDKENILLEFYLITDILYMKEAIFNKIIQDHIIKKVYCKSFDHILLTCSHLFATSSKVIGVVFRDYTKGINIDYENQFKVRLANKSDLPFLLSYDDTDLYQSPEELRYSVSNNMVFMFERENQFIGCGYLIKILSDKNYYDIGMWTNPELRRQGYASMIVSYLKRHCFSHNYTPVCGCSTDNKISRRTFEKNGFISKHCIIEFDIQEKII